MHDLGVRKVKSLSILQNVVEFAEVYNYDVLCINVVKLKKRVFMLEAENEPLQIHNWN